MLETKLIPLVFLFLLNNKWTKSSNILGIFTAPSKSNHMIYNTLMEELSIRGHNVTVATTYRDRSVNIPNYKYIYIHMEDEKNFTEYRHAFFQQKESSSRLRFQDFQDYVKKYTKHSFDFIRRLKIDKLKRNHRFDLVIIGYSFNDFLVGIAAHFECPSIIISANQANIFTNSFIGNPSSVSYTPSDQLVLQHTMTFKERIDNYLTNIMKHVVHFGFDYFVMEPYYIQLFPPHKYPSFSEAKNNVSLVLLANQHFTDGIQTPKMINQIHVGGLLMHKKSNELPLDIKTFLDSAKDGVIYFSLGTNLNSSNLPEAVIDILINEFKKLKQKVLLKWENEEMEHRPHNVMISKWLPQVEVLAHFNTKLFLSHCGLGSITEAKYYGIPVLCISFHGDQHINLQKIVYDGWGSGLTFSNFSKTIFSEKLNRMLSDERYGLKAKELSRLIRDQPLSPMDTAIYWVEYVIRHKGAKHLKSPGQNLNFFLYYSWDVLTVLIIFPYAVAKCLLFFYYFVKRLDLSRKKIKEQ